MTKALETGLPKMRIEEAAARRQAHIDSGAETIIGVNKYPPAEEQPIAYRVKWTIPPCARRRSPACDKLRAERDAAAAQSALDRLKECARSGEGNLLALCGRGGAGAGDQRRDLAGAGKCLGAAQSGQSCNRWRASTAAHSTRPLKWRLCGEQTDDFAPREGRRPRLMVAKMGQDGHDRGAKVIATAFADMGFDVDIAPLFQTPTEVAKQAVENDVHVSSASVRWRPVIKYAACRS